MAADETKEVAMTTQAQERSQLVDELLERIGQTVGERANVSTVFGEPVERENVTVIPVAKTRFGFGGGGGSGEHEGAGRIGRRWRRRRLREPGRLHRGARRGRRVQADPRARWDLVAFRRGHIPRPARDQAASRLDANCAGAPGRLATVFPGRGPSRPTAPPMAGFRRRRTAGSSGSRCRATASLLRRRQVREGPPDPRAPEPRVLDGGRKWAVKDSNLDLGIKFPALPAELTAPRGA